MSDIKKIEVYRADNRALVEEDGEERTGQLRVPDEDGNVYVEVFGTNPFHVKLSEGDAAFLKTVEPQFYDPSLDIDTEGLSPVEIVEAYAAAHEKDQEGHSYPREDGDFIVLGPEIFTGKEGTPAAGVISWKGENFYRTHDGKPPVVKEKNLQPALKDYKVGENVEVDRGGDWLPGRITSIEKSSGYLNVYTERGELSVGSSHRVRKVG